jgi:hypothetical protein
VSKRKLQGRNTGKIRIEFLLPSASSVKSGVKPFRVNNLRDLWGAARRRRVYNNGGRMSDSDAL